MTDGGDKTIVDPIAPYETTEIGDGPTVLASRYELLGLLGSGGMGTVYRARDRELDEIVALKVLKKDLAEDPDMLERFRREVKLARKVTHVNVARTFDIGEDGGDRFLTMELIEGDPLSALMGRSPMPLGRLFPIAQAILDGLAASHDAGVVHGDLKPENVICAKSGRVVITDFGIARALTRDPNAERTAPGVLVGTPQYMAPEQVEGGIDLDGRADLYALGCMLYRLVTGEPAWFGASYVTIAAARLVHEPPDPAERVPDLPKEMRSFLLTCMARERTNRFPDARAASAALPFAMGKVTAPATTAPPTVTAVHARAPVPAPAMRTVAILPIQNQGADDDAYLAAGLTDDLIDMLSTTSRILVRPRGAVAPYAATDRDAREAGRALAVDAVVDGSLRRSGDLLRVTLRLVTVADGFQLWAKRFDRRASDFLAVGDDAAAELADVLTSEKATPPRDSPTDAAALDLYLRGRFIFTRSYFDVAEAVALLRAAHERAPNDGRITAAYSLALMRQHHVAMLPVSVTEQARMLATKVIERDPSIADAHVTIALVHLSQGEVRASAVALVRALEVAPHNIDALHWLGSIFLECGRIDTALGYFARASAEDPELRLAHGSAARAHALRSDWEACDAALDRIVGGGDLLFYWMLRTRFAGWRGDPARCDELLERIAKVPLPVPMLDRLRTMLRVARDRRIADDARQLLRAEMSPVSVPRRNAFNAQIRIEILARANQLEDALANYSVLDDPAFIDIAWMDSCPVLEPLRASAQHRALRKTVLARVERILEAIETASSGLRPTG